MRNMSTEETSRPDEFLAFSRFKEEIESQAASKAEEILKAAKLESDNILSEGKKQADQYKSELLAVAKSEANQIKIREVSRSKLTAKMDYLKIRDKVFGEILLEAKSKIQTYTKSKDYSKFLVQILKISSASINGGNLVVHLRSEDKSLLSQEILDKVSKEVSKETGNKTSLSVAKSDLNALGGLKVIREDDRLFVDNTFEARLVRMDDTIRLSLTELLEA